VSRTQWRKLDVVERIGRGEMTIAEGARALGLSRRQMQRVRKRVRREGQAGVVHGNTGRAPKHKTAKLVRERVIALRRDKYAGFNDQHFTEKLVEVEELELSRASVRRILRAAGIGAVRGRRPPKHRRRRDRRPQAGQMILWDGSRHAWLEERGPRLCLIAAIDDATGELLPGGHFVEQECTVGYLRVLRDIVKAKGIPLSAYMDRHGALQRNDTRWSLEEQLAGRRQPTQVKRALDDLGIQALYALSPQAKGRVERLWGTLQDRLVSELRLVGARTAGEANRVLDKYRLAHNSRFAIPPEEALQAWRPCPDKDTAEALCALQYIRKVANNNSVRIGRRVIDIPRKTNGRATYARTYVTVRHLLDGRYRVYFGGQTIAECKAAPPTEPANQPRTIAAQKLIHEKASRKRRQAAEGVTESLSR
jgi:transposase-like protein